MSTSNEFTSGQKAQIYKRDRATCCFSGANLWLLDAPLRVGWQSDWVDHIRPLSRGGKSDHANGVCASHTFNMKKRNNSADTTYLFRDGRPAEFYYTIHGVPHPAVTDRLKRLANLEESDWYFNRAITWIFEAFDYKFFKPDYVRDDEYWFKAAFAKLVVYRKAKNINRLEERGIITAPSEAQAILLSIRECDTLPLMKKRVLPLFSEYRKNSNAWWNYFGNEEDGADMASRRKASAKAAKAYDSACKIQHTLSADTFACIQAAYQARTT